MNCCRPCACGGAVRRTARRADRRGSDPEAGWGSSVAAVGEGRRQRADPTGAPGRRGRHGEAASRIDADGVPSHAGRRFPASALQGDGRRRRCGRAGRGGSDSRRRVRHGCHVGGPLLPKVRSASRGCRGVGVTFACDHILAACDPKPTSPDQLPEAEMLSLAVAPRSAGRRKRP